MIQAYPLWSGDQCEEIANKVKSNRDLWVRRKPDDVLFYTLGASSYLDSATDYPLIARAYDERLHGLFYTELVQLKRALETITGREFTKLDGTNYPSFHVFDHESNGAQGKPHIDLNHESISWGSTVLDVGSFTVLIEHPVTGAGIEYWPKAPKADIARYRLKGELPRGAYQAYPLGALVIHDGQTPHRIAGGREINDGEHRITLQGHTVILANGKNYVYF